jgi:light-harvesting complex I chlorophyll a/b binding protein 1
MFRIISLFYFICSSVSSLSFPNNKPIIRGPTAPLTNIDLFDKSVVAKDVPIVFLREAELKHGRLAMIAAITLPLTEQFSDDLGISFFQNNPEYVGFGLSLMFISEFCSMIRGWENPTVKLFSLKENYQPGDLFGVNLELMGTNVGNQMDKELNNGRLAMIGIFGMMMQELATQQQLF